MKRYEIIVVGAGHAGVEAANICSQLKNKTLLITNSILEISKISCSPSIGGVGKSQIVKEIDVLGGLMGKAADYSYNHVNILNKSKGLAVRSTRMQIDKYKYPLKIKELLSCKKKLDIIQENVTNLIIKNQKAIGVKISNNINIYAKAIIITTGTFMNCKIFYGKNKENKCRDHEKHKDFLSKNIKKIIPGLKTFKTGTPPRVDLRSVNYKKLKEQKNDYDYHCFCNLSKRKKKLLKSWQTNTNEETKKLIIENKEKSSLTSGIIKSIGPRYCVSIEDKIIRFPKKKKHNIFLEIESKYSNEMYVSGLSNSFDFKTQRKIIKTIKGLEKSKIIKYAYSIEYSYFNPKYLKKNLESKYIKNLFLAGQINGTTGYEEAACQGLYSGIKASGKIKKNNFVIDKKNSYIYVLIKDLTKGIDEPYRMFTTRLKNRLSIREDNTLERLLKISYKNKLIKKKIYYKLKKISQKKIFLLKKIRKKKKIIELIKKKGYSSKNLFSSRVIKKNKDFELFNYIDSEIKYEYYIKKNKKQNKKLKKILDFFIPKNFNFEKIKCIKKEFLEKIKKIKPRVFSEIKKIKGITYSCIFNIKLFFLKNEFKNIK
ncbi:tRNA uridine-5-carboxymethylaminomethyl(34) synthesis enzyme MnmG [Candidatus Vidania fulgoroideorum]